MVHLQHLQLFSCVRWKIENVPSNKKASDTAPAISHTSRQTQESRWLFKCVWCVCADCVFAVFETISCQTRCICNTDFTGALPLPTPLENYIFLWTQNEQQHGFMHSTNQPLKHEGEKKTNAKQLYRTTECNGNWRRTNHVFGCKQKKKKEIPCFCLHVSVCVACCIRCVLFSAVLASCSTGWDVWSRNYYCD